MKDDCHGSFRRFSLFAPSSLHDLLHDSLQTGPNAVNAGQLPNGKALKTGYQQGFSGD
jgi:hypothetical protein